MTKVELFLAAIIGPCQAVEDAYQQLLWQRGVDNAVGVQLDAIGELVGQARNGIADDEIYRRYVRAKIAVNDSDGLIEDVIVIADLTVYEDDAVYHVVNWGTGALVLRVEGVVLEHALAAILVSFLRRAVSGGVRIVLEFYPIAEADTFAFDEGDDGLGWGSTLDADVGGGFASALE